MIEFLNEIIQNPLDSVLIIGNLILIESLLSVDNAAVLATMVMDLPANQREKALKYGIWGAYILRGLAMLTASWLIEIWWLKPLGGLYLLHLTFNWLRTKKTPHTTDDTIVKSNKWLYKNTVGLLGNFWATVVLVEFMDMAFSIDNVFAAVAFTPNVVLVIVGVFIGILAMRLVAQTFVVLMERYPVMEKSAFTVIGILGFKLLLSVVIHLAPKSTIAILLSNHTTETILSLLTGLIFFLPLIVEWILNKKKAS